MKPTPEKLFEDFCYGGAVTAVFVQKDATIQNQIGLPEGTQKAADRIAFLTGVMQNMPTAKNLQPDEVVGAPGATLGFQPFDENGEPVSDKQAAQTVHDRRKILAASQANARTGVQMPPAARNAARGLSGPL